MSPPVSSKYSPEMNTITEEANQFAQFRAYVDDSLIASAASFFDNQTSSIIRELLQNSRRSGATRVDLYQQGKRWVYSDNGPGCSPQDLLGLGASRWRDEIRERETPAGCGFFSLARRNPVVTCPSRGWRINLKEAHFNGQDMVVPEPVSVLPPDIAEKGLIIEFDHGKGEMMYGIEGLARYMPLDFYLNGRLGACREEFLSCPPGSIACEVIEVSQYIKVRVDLVKSGKGTKEVNYNGHVVQLDDYDYEVFGTIEKASYAVQGRIEVAREQALPLELPQRNKIVRSADLEALLKLIKHTGLKLGAENLAEISIASPALWLNERARGYSGPVLYPKFIGRQITRYECVDMSDYSFNCDDSREVFDVGEYITFDTYMTEGYRMTPGNDLLSFLAQTTIPSGMDVDTEFAPGLKLVEPLSWLSGFRVTEGSEGYEWYRRFCALKDKGQAWCDRILLVGGITDENGDALSLECDVEQSHLYDEERLYDWLRLEFRSDDGDEFVFPIEAIFDVNGNSDQVGIPCVLTRIWFDHMPTNFPGIIAEATYRFRKCDEHEGCADSVTVERIQEDLETHLAKFSGLEEFYAAKILEAAIEATEDGLYHFAAKPTQVVVTMKVSGRGRSIDRSESATKFEFEPAFVPCYTFEGSDGTVLCDAQGLRDPRELMNPETGTIFYPEFHSFDIETMGILGLPPGDRDILDACGWHDATRKIYVLPSIVHLLWTAGHLHDPSLDETSTPVKHAIRALLTSRQLPSRFISALWSYKPQLFDAVDAGLIPNEKTWVFGVEP